MEKILISICLLGAKVRYHGGDAYCDQPLLKRWKSEGRLISVCPEVEGGLPTPRPPAEIIGSGGGEAVLNHLAIIKTDTKEDVTAIYVKGANIALSRAKEHHIKIAILKDGSPSCGSSTIYDGSFTGKKITQSGITAALLIKNGIRIFNENQIEEVERYLLKIDPSYK